MIKSLIIDVREPSEFSCGHVEGAINIPPAELMSGSKKLKDVPKDTEIILYCLTGVRAGSSIDILRQEGYTNLVNGININQVMAKLQAERGRHENTHTE